MNILMFKSNCPSNYSMKPEYSPLLTIQSTKVEIMKLLETHHNVKPLIRPTQTLVRKSSIKGSGGRGNLEVVVVASNGELTLCVLP